MLPMQHRPFQLHRSREFLVTARLVAEPTGRPPRTRPFTTNQTASPAPSTSWSRERQTVRGPV